VEATLSLGPVFAFECVTATRRRRMYLGRALFVSVLMVGLSMIWAPLEGAYGHAAQAARIATLFFAAVVSIQLAVVLLVAPAATAGAVCVDKGRGVLHHAFVTDLTGREIILGKLASRLAALLALMACGLPVLALSGLLGGIDLLAAVGSYLVTLGVGVLGCALALTFSVWARKPHQALLPTYALLAAWTGYFPALIGYLRIGPPPTWSEFFWLVALSNPIGCAFATELDPARNMLGAQAAFLGVTGLFALGLVLVAARNVRRVALQQASRPARAEQPGFAARLIARLPEPRLETNPVLWREWHRKRPSRWTGRLWTAYSVASLVAYLWAIGMVYFEPGWSALGDALGFLNGSEVAIGLLLLSISAPMALAEERDRGSLDVIMTTALSTRTIVWGKWWGTFAVVPRLAILPIALTATLVLLSGRWLALAVLIGMIFAPAAALSSLGLALATWLPRASRAVAASLLVYVLATAGGSILVTLTIWWSAGEREQFLMINPFFGVWWATHLADDVHDFDPTWPFLVIAGHLAIAAGLLLATRWTFDRCLGRIPDNPLCAPDPRRAPRIAAARRAAHRTAT
jgi:ABC-type transport system involved in multi-copper enzyme maturation permease subunit